MTNVQNGVFSYILTQLHVGNYFKHNWFASPFSDLAMAPVLYILTSLSILWDFGVFTQVYLLIQQPAVVPGNYVMGIYLFEEAYFKNDYGRGAAISILMLVIVAVLSVFYVRRMLRVGEV